MSKSALEAAKAAIRGVALETAVARLETIVAADPDVPELRALLVARLITGRQLDRAEAALPPLTAPGPLPWQLRADLHRARGEPDLALAYARRTHALFPSGKSLVALARALADDAQEAEAIRLYQDIVATHGGQSARIALAELLIRAGRLDEALATTQAFLQSQPVPSPEVAVPRPGVLRMALQEIQLLSELGQKEAAGARFAALIAARPDASDLADKAAETLRSAGQAVSALTLVETVLTWQPDHAGCGRVRIWPLIALGREDDALEALEARIILPSGSAEDALSLAALASRLNRHDLGCQAITAAVEAGHVSPDLIAYVAERAAAFLPKDKLAGLFPNMPPARAERLEMTL